MVKSSPLDFEGDLYCTILPQKLVIVPGRSVDKGGGGGSVVDNGIDS